MWNSIDVSYSGADVNRTTEYARRRFAFTRRPGRSCSAPVAVRRATFLEAHADDDALAAWAAALRGVPDLSNVRELVVDRAPVTISLTDKQA